jgi:hypothetical protein
MGCITHLELMELAAVAEDIGSDESERICKLCIIGVEVVTSWRSICQSALVPACNADVGVWDGSAYNAPSPSRTL